MNTSMPVVFLAFAFTVPIGLVLFALAWLPTRGLAHSSRIWRLVLASFLAVGFAPSVANICGRDYIVPASWASLYVVSHDDVLRAAGLSCGIFPLIAFVAILFCIWSYYVERKKPVA